MPEIVNSDVGPCQPERLTAADRGGLLTQRCEPLVPDDTATSLSRCPPESPVGGRRSVESPRQCVAPYLHDWAGMDSVCSYLRGLSSIAVVAMLGWGSPACSGSSTYRQGDGAAPDSQAPSDGAAPLETGTPPDTGAPADSGPTCQPILNGGQDTGFDTCSNGVERRRAAVVCPFGATTAVSQCASCTSDADCTAQPMGYCADIRHLAGYCGCFYGCRKDADCGAGFVCACDSVVGHCVAASCTTGADCGAGLDCIVTAHSTSPTMCPYASDDTFACETPADTCFGSRDCGDTSSTPASCVLVGDRRVCGVGCI